MASNYWCCGSLLIFFLISAHFNLIACIKQNEDFFQFENNSLDITMLKSKNEKYLVYRNAVKKECYLERVTSKNSEDEQNSRTLYVGQEQLKKSDKVYSELDDETQNFCHQFAIFILQEQPPTYYTSGEHGRIRRDVQMSKKQRYPSQTQMQYISFDNTNGNKTAEPTHVIIDPEKSRITVSGNLRLAQSRSQFESFDCSKCGNWSRSSQKSSTFKYPVSSEAKSPAISQFNLPSIQPKHTIEPQIFIQESIPSESYPNNLGVELQNAMRGHQMIPQPNVIITIHPNSSYQVHGNISNTATKNELYDSQQTTLQSLSSSFNHNTLQQPPRPNNFPNTLQTIQPLGDILTNSQPARHFTPISQTGQQNFITQNSQYLPPSSDSVPQPGPGNTLSYSQPLEYSSSSSQLIHQPSSDHTAINFQTVPVFSSNSQPVYHQGLENVISYPQTPHPSLTSQPQEKKFDHALSDFLPAQNFPKFPTNLQPSEQFSSRGITSFPNIPGYYSSSSQLDQQHTQPPQPSTADNMQMVHSQRPGRINIHTPTHSYQIPTLQYTQQDFRSKINNPKIFSDIPLNLQISPTVSSGVVATQPQTTGYFYSTSQSTHQQDAARGQLDSQSYPIGITPSVNPPTVTHFFPSVQATQLQDLAGERANSQSTNNIPQTNLIPSYQSIEYVKSHSQNPVYLPSSFQPTIYQGSTGIPVQSASTFPTQSQFTPQYLGNIVKNSQTQQNFSPNLLPVLQQNLKPIVPNTPSWQYFPTTSQPTYQQNSASLQQKPHLTQVFPPSQPTSVLYSTYTFPQPRTRQLASLSPSQLEPTNSSSFQSPVSNNIPSQQPNSSSSSDSLYKANYPQYQYFPEIINIQQPQSLSTGASQIQPYQYFPSQDEITFPQNKLVKNQNYTSQQEYRFQQQAQSIPTGIQENQLLPSHFIPLLADHANQNPHVTYPSTDQPDTTLTSPLQKNSSLISVNGRPVVSKYPQETDSSTNSSITSGTHSNKSATPNESWMKVLNAESPVETPADISSEEALSISGVNIVNNATRAESISLGKTKNGVVKAEVSGTYTKDFAAKAESTDNEKSAISQIFGNSTGAMSTSYGRAGKSQSQSQILFSHETGSSVAESQGSGASYDLTGQIQVGYRGGQADSQATGPGSTFSQAQIGFVPNFKENSIQQSIFQGGGVASSNISRHSGLTEIRFQGQFKSNPSFMGQAQAGAGRNNQNKTRIAFNSTNLTNLVQKDALTTTVANTIADIIIQDKKINDENATKNENLLKLSLPEPYTKNSLDTLNDFGTQSSNPQKRLLRGQFNSNQKSAQGGKNNVINPTNYDSSRRFINPGDTIPGINNYRIPLGFRGRFFPEEIQLASSNGKLLPTRQTLMSNSDIVTEMDFSGPTKQEKIYIQKDNFDNSQYHVKGDHDGYTTITKSETGELKDNNKNYGHTYYTKSSACGYFTYTCNFIDGPDGRTKICKQDPQINTDGTLC